ncbi:protein of unknown function [Methylocaldum szegediense]|uniref:Uncharacterized protein n=1 Tax=Methylocaldum szegediense TaxID=73780 RepID=A0ABM9I9E6_9GAMM|nr:protein of unknown function [Methylocaldum szegediense]
MARMDALAFGHPSIWLIRVAKNISKYINYDKEYKFISLNHLEIKSFA